MALRSASSLALWPNMFFLASSSSGSCSNLPTASPACTWGRPRTLAVPGALARGVRAARDVLMVDLEGYEGPLHVLLALARTPRP